MNQVISPLDRWGQLWSRPNGSAEWPRRVMEARESSEGPLQLWWHMPRAPSGGVVGHDLAAPPPGRGDHTWPTLGSTHTPLVFPRACWHGSAAVVGSSALTHLSVCPPIIHCPVHPPESLWTAWSSGKGRPAQRAALAARPCVGCGYPWSSPGLPEPRLTVPGPVPRTQGQPLPAGHSQPSTGGRTGHPPVHCQRDTRGHGNRRALRPLGGPGVGGRRKDFWRMLGASQLGGEGASGLLRTLASRGRRGPAAVRARGGGWGGGRPRLPHTRWLACTHPVPAVWARGPQHQGPRPGLVCPGCPEDWGSPEHRPCSHQRECWVEGGLSEQNSGLCCLSTAVSCCGGRMEGWLCQAGRGAGSVGSLSPREPGACCWWEEQ